MLLARYSKCPDGIFSTLIDDAGQSYFVGEHSYSNLPKIVDGTYTCIRRLSPKFGYDVFEVTNVPNCTYIEIHKGNIPNVDSDGCLLLGQAQEGLEIINSKLAFDQFMTNLTGVNSFQLVVQ